MISLNNKAVEYMQKYEYSDIVLDIQSFKT